MDFVRDIIEGWRLILLRPSMKPDWRLAYQDKVPGNCLDSHHPWQVAPLQATGRVAVKNAWKFHRFFGLENCRVGLRAPFGRWYVKWATPKCFILSPEVERPRRSSCSAVLASLSYMRGMSWTTGTGSRTERKRRTSFSMIHYHTWNTSKENSLIGPVPMDVLLKRNAQLWIFYRTASLIGWNVMAPRSVKKVFASTT